jgi:hypothetical protein
LLDKRAVDIENTYSLWRKLFRLGRENLKRSSPGVDNKTNCCMLSSFAPRREVLREKKHLHRV